MIFSCVAFLFPLASLPYLCSGFLHTYLIALRLLSSTRRVPLGSPYLLAFPRVLCSALFFISCLLLTLNLFSLLVLFLVTHTLMTFNLTCIVLQRML